MSCGQEPPSEPYRWRRRVCTDCSGRLRGGCVSWAGAQTQLGLQTPSAACGLVYKRGQTYPPSSKWASVDIPSGAIEYCEDLLVKPRGRIVGRRWKPATKELLAELSRYVLEEKAWPIALGGVGITGATPMCSATNCYNQFKALAGRAFRTPKYPGPRPGIFKHVYDYFKDVLLPDLIAAELSVEEWLQTMPARRKKILRRAAREYAERGWTDRLAKFTAFVKTEFLPDFEKDAYGLCYISTMLDRLIQGPNDCTHVIAGRRIKPLCWRLKQVWDYTGPIFYGSATPEKLHKWLQRLVESPGTYFWCDYSMFDNTHSSESWEFIERLYKDAGIEDEDFWRVMEVWRAPKGTIGPFRYKAKVMNASGRDDTAFANAVLNGFAAYLSVCAAWLDKPLLSLTPTDVYSCYSEVFISVCGDDSLGRVPYMTVARREKFCRDVTANIALFGFEAKLMASDRLSDAVYLGMRPYPTRQGWFWGKTIGRAVYKMGWVCSKTPRDVLAHITGTHEMHLLCSSHVPIISDLARKVVELREGAKRTPVKLDPDKPWEWTYQSGVDYDDVTLAAVAETYSTYPTTTKACSGPDHSITVADLKATISAIRSITQIPYQLDSDVIRRMIWFDDL